MIALYIVIGLLDMLCALTALSLVWVIRPPWPRITRWKKLAGGGLFIGGIIGVLVLLAEVGLLTWLVYSPTNLRALSIWITGIPGWLKFLLVILGGIYYFSYLFVGLMISRKVLGVSVHNRTRDEALRKRTIEVGIWTTLLVMILHVPIILKFLD